MPLAQDQRATLSILGYLFYRMGRLDSAAKVFAALIALAPAEADGPAQRWPPSKWNGAGDRRRCPSCAA